MPITTDIRDHAILGPLFRMDPLLAERTVVSWLVAMRFGRLPPWAEERVYRFSAAELQDVIDHLLEAKSIEQLLQ